MKMMGFLKLLLSSNSGRLVNDLEPVAYHFLNICWLLVSPLAGGKWIKNIRCLEKMMVYLETLTHVVTTDIAIVGDRAMSG